MATSPVGPVGLLAQYRALLVQCYREVWSAPRRRLVFLLGPLLGAAAVFSAIRWMPLGVHSARSIAWALAILGVSTATEVWLARRQHMVRDRFRHLANAVGGVFMLLAWVISGPSRLAIVAAMMTFWAIEFPVVFSMISEEHKEMAAMRRARSDA